MFVGDVGVVIAVDQQRRWVVLGYVFFWAVGREQVGFGNRIVPAYFFGPVAVLSISDIEISSSWIF